MVNTIQVVRACLAAGALYLLPTWAQAEDACGPTWHLEAEKTARLGLQLLHSGYAGDRVRLWRLLELGEDIPDGGRDADFATEWHGTWQEEKNANDFLTGHAVTRGVSWTPKRTGYRGRPNIWFAAKLFEERRQLLGDDHPYLKQWLQNQQAVFTRSPEPLADVSAQYTGLAAELAADDIRYQQAALQFYAGEFSAAAEGFRAIAAQPASRYRSIAAYMAARSLVHAERLEESLAEISNIENSLAFEDVHAISQQLFGVISWDSWYFRKTSSDGESPAGVQEAARRLLLSNAQALRLPLATLQSDPAARAHYWQAVYDLAFFLRSDWSRHWMRGEVADDWWLDTSRAETAGVRTPAVGPAAREDDLVDWLESTEQVRMLASGPWLAFWSTRTGSSSFLAAADHVRQRAAQTNSLSWVIAHAMRSTESRGVAASAFHDITSRLASCSASHAELLALGPLRYHVTRAQMIGQHQGYYPWRMREAGVERLAGLDPSTRLAALRFSLALSGSRENLPQPDQKDPGVNRLLSRTLGEFMAVREDYGDGHSAVINMLPARVLLQLASDETLPEEYRASLIRNVWTRAYLLQDDVVLRPATELLAKLNPALSSLANTYRDAWTETGRKQAALWLLLRAPSMQLFMPGWSDVGYGYRQRNPNGIAPGKWSWFLSSAESSEDAIALFWADDWNHNDGNWWCRPDITRMQSRLQLEFYDRPLALAPSSNRYYGSDPRAHAAYPLSLMQQLGDRRREFLSAHPVLKMIDWEELGKLSKVPAAPEYLTREVISWAKEASWIDRWLYEDEMAEALALVVRVTRFGCHRDGSNRKHSYAAFQLLHEMFPDSEAAKHTRYWYN